MILFRGMIEVKTAWAPWKEKYMLASELSNTTEQLETAEKCCISILP